MSGMKKEQVDYFRDLLQGRLQELLSNADDTVNEMTGEIESFPDPTDRASLESDRNFTLRIRDRERKLIGKIKAALERIEDGSFGVMRHVRRGNLVQTAAGPARNDSMHRMQKEGRGIGKGQGALTEPAAVSSSSFLISPLR